MAELGIDTDTEDEEVAAPAGGDRANVLKIVIPGGIAIFLAVLAAQVTAPLVTQLIAGSADSAAQTSDQEDDSLAEPVLEAPPPEIEPRSLEPAIYTPLDPALVVSFPDGAGHTRFLQLNVQAMSRNQKAIDQIRQHAPALRNSFLFLISRRSVDELGSVEGKEKLRADMLEEAREIMRLNTGDPSIEQLYFTSLVIQ